MPLSEEDREKSISEKVDDLILKNTRGNDFPRAIFLTPDDYKEFMLEVFPKYREQYGSLIVDEEFMHMGIQNILYSGLAICLMPEGWVCLCQTKTAKN